MTGVLPQPELPDDWIVALHESIVADTHVESPTAPDERARDQIVQVRSCLHLLEDLRQANRASGGMIRQLLELSDELDETEDAEPTRIGRFEILEELGRGGHGIVLLAYDPTLKRQVALKVPRPELLANRQMRERFVREANAAARLTHPAIVQIYELGDAGPVCYIAAEFCPGRTLAESLRASGPFCDSQSAARVLLSLADAVEYANSRGVLHRDLKPANVMLVPAETRLASTQGGTEARATDFEPKLTDFGLAKLSDTESEYTRTGVLLGTPAYMAPEQAHGQTHELAPATDVYGLGTILYEILAGRPPFVGASDLEILRQVAEADPTPLSKIRPGISPDIAAICYKCLEKKPAARYATAAELAADLRRFLAGEPTTARPATPLERTVKWIRRYPMAAALIGVTTAALLLISIGGWIAYDRTRQARDEARLQRQEAQASAADALASGQKWRRQYYASTISRAWLDWEHDHYSEACDLLDRCLPAAGEEDLRESAWYQLWNFTHQFQSSLKQHTGPVYRAKFSPNGEWIASCGQDKTVCVWSAQTGQLQHVLSGHTGEVNGIAFSSDGRFIASVSDDASVRIWEAATGAEKTTLMPQQGRVVAVAFSPDGQVMATGGEDARIVMWDASTWTERHSLVHHTDQIEDLAFSPDGSLLASASDDKTAKPWNTSTWDLIETLVPSDNGMVNCLAFSRDGRHLATGGRSDRRVRLWDLTARRELKVLLDTKDWVQSLAFFDDDRQLAVATKQDVTDGRVEIISLQDGTTRKLLGHKLGVWSVDVAPNGGQLVTSGADGTIKTWDLRGVQPERTFADRGPLRAVAYAADGRLCFGGDDAFSLQVLDPSDDGQPKQIGASQSLIGDFDADGFDDRFWFHEGQWTIELAGDKTAPAQSIAFGAAGDVPLVGDWNGDGKADLGVYRQGKFLLKATTSQGDYGYEFVLGGASSIPLVADWDGNGYDEVGVIEEDRVLIDLRLTGRPAEYQATLPADDKPAIVSLAARLGKLDTTFGSNGIHTHGLKTRTDATAVAMQADGRIVASFNGADVQPSAHPAMQSGVLRFNANGTLEAGFRVDDVGDDAAAVPESTAETADLAIQPDGKIVILQGESKSGETRWRLRRLLADGTADTTFGPARDGNANIELGPQPNRIFRMVRQSDGKLVLAGYVPRPDSKYSQVVLARFNTDGTSDASFGPDKSGIVVTTVGQHTDQARCVCQQPDGKILIGGISWNLNQTFALVVRYNPDGSLDESFAEAGKLRISPPGVSAAVFDLVAEVSGDIIVVGNLGHWGATGMLARFDNSGKLDTSFGSQGWVSVPLSMENSAFARVALDSQNRIVVAGTSGADDTASAALLRFLPDGSLDADFRSELHRHPALASVGHSANGLAIDAADRPIMVAYMYSNKQYHFLASRFLAEPAESQPISADKTDAQNWPDVRQMQKEITTELIEHARARAVGAAPPRPVSCLAISPSGDVVATCSSPDHFVRVLEVASGRELAVLTGHQAEVLGLAFSPDGRCLATAGQDALLRVWDAQNWKLVAELAGHTLPVQAVAFSSDGKLLASAGKDGARIWRRSDFQQVTNIAELTGFSCIAFSPDSRTLATGGDDEVVKLWDVSTGHSIAKLTGHTGAVRAISFAPNGRTLASCGADRFARLWDLLTHQELIALTSGGRLVNSLMFSPDGDELTSVEETPTSHGELRIRNGRASPATQLRPSSR